MPASPTFSELRERERNLKSLLDQARRLSAGRGDPRGRGIEDFRARDAARKRESLEAKKGLYIPKPQDPAHRALLETDVFEWLRWYFGADAGPGADIFTEPFQQHHIGMIQAIEDATVHAGDQAIAAPRGEGKSTIAECVTIYNILQGKAPFVVLLAATANDATNSLGSMKQYIARSDRLLADYPEVCVPVRDVDSTPNRAHSCVVHGDDFPFTHARFQWSGDEISMPMVPGSVSAGAIIATRGLDAAIRGLKKGKVRPSLAIIDDPDTENTARSPEQAKKLSNRIERGIALLAPKGKRMSRVMLTTTQTQTCVSATFTDPKLKPSWKGKRFAFLQKKPDKEEMWSVEYIAIRQQGMTEGDEFGRRAHAFYLAHREEMDAGAVVANPFSYDGRTLPDGSQLQVSAIQRYYDFVADNGEEAALCELQNNPPDEAKVQESGITPSRIQCQVSGYPRRIIPPGCIVLTQGIDVNKSYCHWVVRSWRPEPTGYATGFAIDYGITEVYGTTRGSDEGLDEARVRALHVRRAEMTEYPYQFETGEILEPQLNLIDSKWRKEAVFRFCDEAGWGWYPAVGYGRSSGCAGPNFREPVKSNPDKVMSWQAFSAPRSDGGWMIHINADHYKAWEHDRWMSDPRRPGALLLFGEPGRGTHRSEMSSDEKGHLSYAHHICAEIEVEEPVRGIMKRYWKEKSHNNHWLDASYRASCAAAMCGIRLYGMPVYVPEEESGPASVVTMPNGEPFCVLDRV
jgi:hypothetical protein